MQFKKHYKHLYVVYIYIYCFYLLLFMSPLKNGYLDIGINYDAKIL